MDAWWQQFITVLTNPWAAVGFAGQMLFFCRWIVQWYVSERQRRSTVPLVFWYISLTGGLLVMVYAIQRHDPVFMLGQAIGIANYTRNIMLIRKYGDQASTAGSNNE